MHDLCLKYDHLIKLWLGPAILWILVNDPKTIQKVLLSPVCLEKPFFYKFLRLDSGLISARYDVWKIHRRSLNYSFNLKILQTFIPIFIENAQKLVNDLATNVSKRKEFDMLAYTSSTALNMICCKKLKIYKILSLKISLKRFQKINFYVKHFLSLFKNFQLKELHLVSTSKTLHWVMTFSMHLNGEFYV